MRRLFWCRGVVRLSARGGHLIVTAVILCLALSARPSWATDGQPSLSDPPAQATAYSFDPAPPKPAETLFREGHFLEAAKIAEDHGTAESLAFAARATLMHAGYVARGDKAVAELKHGEALARRAVGMDPDMVEGLLELVIAIGYHSRQEGYMQAHADGYGKEARQLIEKAMDLAPRMGWARAAYGGWNAEIVARGGSLLGGLVYGASRKKAVEAFEKAVAFDPDNPTIRIEYAKALIRMEPKRPDLDKIRTQLNAALSEPPKGAAEKIIQAQGKELLAAVNADESSGLEKVVDRLTPFEK